MLKHCDIEAQEKYFSNLKEYPKEAFSTKLFSQVNLGKIIAFTLLL